MSQASDEEELSSNFRFLILNDIKPSSSQSTGSLSPENGIIELYPVRPDKGIYQSSSSNDLKESVNASSIKSDKSSIDDKDASLDIKPLMVSSSEGMAKIDIPVSESVYPESINNSWHGTEYSTTDRSSCWEPFKFPKIGPIRCTFDNSSICDMRATELADWCTMYQTKQSDLCQGMRSKILVFKDTDLNVQVGNTFFQVHKIVLQACSNYFAQRWDQEALVLPASKVSANVFYGICKWMTGVEIYFSYKDILESLITLNFLDVPMLLSEVWTCIDNESVFKEDTAFMIYTEARTRGLDNVVVLMLPRISKFFLTLVATLDFVKLDIEDLCALLSSSIISVNTEEEVFLAAIRWLASDWEKRKAEMLRVMLCVRFNLLPLSFNTSLIKLVAQNKGGVLAQVASNELLQHCIKESIKYTTIHDLYFDDPKRYLEDMKVMLARNRRFIYDPLSSYHLKWNEFRLSYVDYNTFCQYLCALREKEVGYFENLESYNAAGEAIKDENFKDNVNGFNSAASTSKKESQKAEKKQNYN